MLIVVEKNLEAEIEELCRTAAIPQLRAITTLLQAHADSQHIVIAPPSICRIWEGCPRLSEEQRGVAKKIRARYSELAELENIVPVYAKIVSAVPKPIRDGKAWLMPLAWVAVNGLASTHLVCEDLYDCSLVRGAAFDYLGVKSLHRLSLSLENSPGGGGNTHRVLSDKAIDGQRVSLCFVDSDRDEPSPTSPLGLTASRCLQVEGSGIYEVSITLGREMENHIPTRLVDKVRTKWDDLIPSEKQVKLTEVSPQMPLFLDMKAGLKKKEIQSFVGDKLAFWGPISAQLEVGKEKCCPTGCSMATVGDCKLSLVPPLGRTLLKDVAGYLEQTSTDSRRYKGYLPSNNQDYWLSMGALAAAYGLSVKVTAAM